jgi:hypothetical protein
MGWHMALATTLRWHIVTMMGVIPRHGRSCLNVFLLSPPEFMHFRQYLLLLSWMEALLNMMHKGLRRLRGSTTRRILQCLIIMSSSKDIDDADGSVLVDIMSTHGRRIQKFGEFSSLFILVSLVPQLDSTLGGLH